MSKLARKITNPTRSMVFTSAILFAAFANAQGGKAKVISINDAHNGKIYSARPGDTIIVTLSENASTGMQLNYLDPSNGILKLKSKQVIFPEKSSKKPAPGTPHMVRYTFSVGNVASGASFSQAIRFVVARPYGRDVNWEKMFSVDIDIKK